MRPPEFALARRQGQYNSQRVAATIIWRDRLPRPRDLDSRGYLEKRDRIFRVMGMSLRVGEIAAA
jgi:hypothetical protein